MLTQVKEERDAEDLYIVLGKMKNLDFEHACRYFKIHREYVHYTSMYTWILKQLWNLEGSHLMSVLL